GGSGEFTAVVPTSPPRGRPNFWLQRAVLPSPRQREFGRDRRAHSDAGAEFCPKAKLFVSGPFRMTARQSRNDLPSLGLDNEISEDHNPKGQLFPLEQGMSWSDALWGR